MAEMTDPRAILVEKVKDTGETCAAPLLETQSFQIDVQTSEVHGEILCHQCGATHYLTIDNIRVNIGGQPL